MPETLHGLAVRYVDGVVHLIIHLPESSPEKTISYRLKPVHLLTLAADASRIAWAEFNLTEREALPE